MGGWVEGLPTCKREKACPHPYRDTAVVGTGLPHHFVGRDDGLDGGCVGGGWVGGWVGWVGGWVGGLGKLGGWVEGEKAA